MNRNERKRIALVIWFTGLSGSGKSTLSEKLNQFLRQEGYYTELLDGDVIRNIFKETGFTRPERMRHLKSMSFLASMIERQETIVIGSFITPYEEARDLIRNACHRYVEVWIDASIETCEKRDVKGLYQKARRGEITSFTGISDPFEIPQKADIHVSTDNRSVEESFNDLMTQLRQKVPELSGSNGI